MDSPTFGHALPAEGWMVAQIRPNAVALARRNLQRQGFAVFMPTMLATRRRNDRLVTQTEPAFPGYLFVHTLPGSAAPGAIGNTLGVTRLLLTPARAPATLPAGLVPALAARCDDAGVIQPAAPAAGQAVRITAGPFSDNLTRIESVDAAGRVQVLLQLLGGQVRVTLPPGQVRPE